MESYSPPLGTIMYQNQSSSDVCSLCHKAGSLRSCFCMIDQEIEAGLDESQCSVCVSCILGKTEGGERVCDRYFALHGVKPRFRVFGCKKFTDDELVDNYSVDDNNERSKEELFSMIKGDFHHSTTQISSS